MIVFVEVAFDAFLEDELQSVGPSFGLNQVGSGQSDGLADGFRSAVDLYLEIC